MRQEAIGRIKEENAQAVAAKQKSLEAEYQQFRAHLAEERESLKSTVLSQLPLIKESLKAKFSQI
jgi:F-type H+-transporting ATPase subunit b